MPEGPAFLLHIAAERPELIDVIRQRPRIPKGRVTKHSTSAALGVRGDGAVGSIFRSRLCISDSRACSLTVQPVDRTVAHIRAPFPPGLTGHKQV